MEKEWMRDLKEESVDREAKFDVKERIELPNIGDNVEVTFLSEPRKIAKEDTRLDRDMFVADVDDGSEITKQIVCSKSIRQHLAALLERGDINQVPGSRVIISAHEIPEFKTSEGDVIKDAKVYRVALASSSKNDKL